MAMKLSWIPAMALVVVSFPLVAQNQSGTANPGVATIQSSPAQLSWVVNPPASCPVDLRAQHLAYAAPLKAGEAAPRGQGQKLHLTLGSAAARQIVRATITLHGLRPTGHVRRAAPGQSPSSDAVQTLTVPFSKGADGIATADVWAPGFTAIETIDLKSVVYTDGSTWSLADGATCRIVPDPFMLVTQH
jgi:hypothetical protein